MPPVRHTFDTLAPGDVLDLGSRQVTEAEIVAFASDFDPQPFHTDPVAAAASMPRVAPTTPATATEDRATNARRPMRSRERFTAWPSRQTLALRIRRPSGHPQGFDG